jgi:hypothetical protein
VKCGFSVDRVGNNDDSAVKLCEDEEDDWYNLQPLGVQFEDYITFDNALEVCGNQSVSQKVDQHLTRPEKKRKLWNIKQHSWMHQKDWMQPESTYVSLIQSTVLLYCAMELKVIYTD